MAKMAQIGHFGGPRFSQNTTDWAETSQTCKPYLVLSYPIVCPTLSGPQTKCPLKNCPKTPKTAIFGTKMAKNRKIYHISKNWENYLWTHTRYTFMPNFSPPAHSQAEGQLREHTYIHTYSDTHTRICFKAFQRPQFSTNLAQNWRVCRKFSPLSFKKSPSSLALFNMEPGPKNHLTRFE